MIAASVKEFNIRKQRTLKQKDKKNKEQKFTSLMIPLFCEDLPAEYKKAWKVTERLLIEMRDYAVKKGSGFMIMSIPSGIQLLPKEKWDNLIPKKSYDRSERILTDICNKEKIAYINLLPEFLENSKKTKKYPHFMMYGGLDI